MFVKSGWTEQIGKGGGAGGEQKRNFVYCSAILPDFYSYLKASYFFYYLWVLAVDF